MVAQARRVIEIEVIADQALRRLGGIERAAEKSERSLALMTRQVDALGTAFRGAVGFLGIQEFTALADAATDIESRLNSVAGSVTAGDEAFESLLDVALRLGVGIEGLAGAYTRLGIAAPIQPHEELVQALDVVATILATTGASVQQVNAVLLQFSQGLNSSAVQGDEFRSLAENAPVLLKAWRDAIGETDTSFKELSASAKLTTESFFENLDAVEENAIAILGMSEPALTVARALENLRTQTIALVGDSEGISLTFAALAQGIDLIAGRLDLLVNLALAFGALKLTEIFAALVSRAGEATNRTVAVATATAKVGDASKDVEKGLSAANVQQAFFLAATDAWLGFVDNTRDLGKAFGSTNAVLRGFVTLLDTTVGRFVAWVAVIESASFAYERLVDAIEQQDRFLESAQKSAAVTRTLVDEIINARDALETIETRAPAEIAEQFAALEAALESADDRIEEITRELEDLRVPNIFEVFFGRPQQEEDRIRGLEQELESLTRLVETAGVRAFFDLADAQFDAERRANGLENSLSRITSQLKAVQEAAERLSRERLELRFDLELAQVLSPGERIEVEVRQSFDRITEAARASIDQVAAQLRFLEEQRRTAQFTPEEVEKLDKEIEKLNRSIDESAATIAANERARQEQTRGLIEQRTALAENEKAVKALADAQRLIRDEFSETVDRQFALQELYEAGVISANQLADALNKLGEATSNIDTEAQIENQLALRDANAQTAREIDNARARFETYLEAGEQGLKLQEAQIAVTQAVADAYEQLGRTVGDELTPEQQQLVDSTRELAVELQGIALAQEAAERARELGLALTDAGRSATQAEGALAAFRRGGATELEQFEQRIRLQEAFTDALRDQNTTFENAAPEQLRFAQEITEALGRQLQAQEELNRAKAAEADISAFQAQVAGISAPGEAAAVPGRQDVLGTIDQAQSARLRGERSQAEALLELARTQTEQFAETVDSLYDERQLERLKTQLGRAAETILAAVPLEEVDVDDVQQELHRQELFAPVQFDPESVQAAIAQLQEALNTTPVQVPVTLAPGQIPTPVLQSGGIRFGTGAGIPPGTDLPRALTGVVAAVGS